MRRVRDESGTRYLLLAESEESSRVRNLETGEEGYLPNAALEPVDGEPPLVAAAGTVPAPVRTLLTAVRDERELGLLVELDARGGVAVRDLLADCDLCESDLHGILAEFRAAGLVAETEVGGERGYRTTETASEALGHLR